MEFKRKSGILLHPTSLPGKYGIGTIGKAAYDFVDWLVQADQTLWQILPLGPTGYGDSPYASFSTYAGNPLLIDLEKLVERGWAQKKEIVPPEYIKKDGNVDFGSVVWWKLPVLKNCAAFFLKNASEEDRKLYNSFCEEKSHWLNNFASFMSIKAVYDKKSEDEKPANSLWYAYWPSELARCEKDAVNKWNEEHQDEIEVLKVIQFFFDIQWNELKAYANENGISIIGDIPIYVAIDSADVWSNQRLFDLDENGKPNNVAGVPPDYFSAEGQLWGNPIYNWDAMKAEGYNWWIERIKRVFELTDILRIDHFLGFDVSWAVPYGEKNAINGKWRKGPGIDLFNAIKNKLGDLPIIAEDLGNITEDVKKLRDDCGFPGMKVLQFAFGIDEVKKNGMINDFIPHNFKSSSCVIYSGTHDNDTMQGWLNKLNSEELDLVASYVTGKRVSSHAKAESLRDSKVLLEEFIKLAYSSTAVYAILPVQDILGVGNEGRMNTPSTTGANWSWRMSKNSLKNTMAEKLSYYSFLYGRNID